MMHTLRSSAQVEAASGLTKILQRPPDTRLIKLARSTGLIVVSSGRDAVRLDDWALTWRPGRPDPHYLMGHADRGQPPPDGRGLAAFGHQRRDVEGRGRRQRLDRRDPLGAPGAEVGEVGFVGPPRRAGPG